MLCRKLRLSRALGWLLFLGWPALATAGTATITVDPAKPGPRLNPAMYGIFLEEINHGVDGGLYGELIANRAFEASRPPEGCVLQDGRWKAPQGWDSGFEVKEGDVPRWSLVRQGAARGRMVLESSGGLNDNSPYCLRLEVEEAAGGRIGVANEGFWGIGVATGEKYNLTVHLRSAAGFAGPVTVALEDAAGTPCSDTARFEAIGSAWRPFKAILTATRSEPKARLVISAGSKGRLWLDFVSLFPQKTFKGRANGLRLDIAQMIADLKPGFVRFPGGCVVEGGNLETAYNWKLTTGPVERRPERWNAWNYRRTHGMGAYEYLQFCEDLGAEPMWVGFAGQTCLYRHADHVPMDQMGPICDGFLDLLEYANGPANSRWGALRTQSGHAAPFGIKLVEIGNENGMKQYEDRYKFIHPALKSRYPEVTYIADYAIPGAPCDLVDDHFYNSPDWFLSRLNHYDSRSRSLPKVYVGEIAVTSPEGGPDKGNLIAALSEGVFLMGLERNADVVRMVSYAPLLAHVSGRSGWHGMIYFDSTRAYGTVSYHLWKLFGLNRPTFTVDTKVEVAAAEPPPITGAIGLGTWNTSAEFKEIRVEKEGRTLYTSDFSAQAKNWKAQSGRWSVNDGAYRQSDNTVGLSYFGDEAWSGYTLRLKARKLAGDEGFLICFGRRGEDQYWWNIGGWGNREHGIELNRTPVGPHVAGRVEPNRWYDVSIELTGARVRCYLDGKLVHDETTGSTQRFFAVAGKDEASGDLLVKVINASGDRVDATLNIAGAAAYAPEARLTLLSSAAPGDNNTLERPDRIVPQAAQARLEGTQLKHGFAPYSFTLIRLKSR